MEQVICLCPLSQEISCNKRETLFSHTPAYSIRYIQVRKPISFLNFILLLWPWEISWDQYKLELCWFFSRFWLVDRNMSPSSGVNASDMPSRLSPHLLRLRSGSVTNMQALFLSSKMGMKRNIFPHLFWGNLRIRCDI